MCTSFRKTLDEVSGCKVAAVNDLEERPHARSQSNLCIWTSCRISEVSEFAGSLIRDPTDFFGGDEIKRTVFVTLISSMFLIS